MKICIVGDGENCECYTSWKSEVRSNEVKELIPYFNLFLEQKICAETIFHAAQTNGTG